MKINVSMTAQLEDDKLRKYMKPINYLADLDMITDDNMAEITYYEGAKNWLAFFLCHSQQSYLNGSGNMTAAGST